MTVTTEGLSEQAALSTGFESETSDISRDFFSFHLLVAKDISPWWSRQRDSELRTFWKDGAQGGSLMYRAQSKLAAIPLRVIARDTSIASHVRQAEMLEARLKGNSGFGSGLHDVMLRACEDYLGQDNGMFIEILGEGDPIGPISGAVYGLKHLDASRCTRTGHPVYPVIYTGDDGRQYKIHAARVLFFSQMPSARASMFGVGYGSVSRSLRIVQNLHHIIDYKDEKMGARASSQILVGTGITGKEIIKAMAASEAMMDNLGLKNMIRTTAIGSPGGEVDLKRVELNNLDPFDEETTYTFAAYALALAWGLEFNEVMPIQASKGSDIASLQKSRAMLPQTYRESFQQQADLKLVPAHLKVVLDYYDDMHDQQRAVIEDITSRSLSRQIDSGYTTKVVVQEKLHEQGYVNDSQLRAMKLDAGMLADNSPIQSVFFDKKYDEFFLIPREMLMTLSWGESEDALALLEANKIHIYQLIGQRRSSVFRNLALDALAAVEEVEKKYMALAFKSTEENDEEQAEEIAAESKPEEELDEEEGSNESDGRLTNRETGQQEAIGKDGSQS